MKYISHRGNLNKRIEKSENHPEYIHEALSKNYDVVMTSDTHTRALDRVAEAVEVCGRPVGDADIVVCVQGDEPLLGPDIIEMIVDPLIRDPSINGTILAVPIIDEETFFHPDAVKLVHNRNFDVLYTV